MTRNEADGPLRISGLIGCPVRDSAGAEIGQVADVRLRPHRPYGATVLRVESVLVDRRHLGRLFGYERHRQQGPWLLRTVIRRLHRHARMISWSDVEHASLTRAARELRLLAGFPPASRPGQGAAVHPFH